MDDLIHIFNLIRLIKYVKYRHSFENFSKNSQIHWQTLRIIYLSVLALILTHIFTCLWFLSAKMRGFSKDTWVSNTGSLDQSTSRNYAKSLYWACQTLTTVGYGDFGSYNRFELAMTLIWQFLGVIIYTVIFSSLTSSFNSSFNNAKKMEKYIKNLSEVYEKINNNSYRKQTPLDPEVFRKIKSFLYSNFQ